jgi:hypothetical protein
MGGADHAEKALRVQAKHKRPAEGAAKLANFRPFRCFFVRGTRPAVPDRKKRHFRGLQAPDAVDERERGTYCQRL